MNYKKADFINDILTIFNAIIITDKNNENSLSIYAYDEYYNDIEFKDWTNKVVVDSVYVESLKNSMQSLISFSNATDSDVFNTDYVSKRGKPFGFLDISNDSEFSTGKTDIKLSIPPTIEKEVVPYWDPNTPNPYLSVNPTNMSVTYSSCSTTFNISSNIRWNLIPMESWVSVNPTSGTGNSTVTVTVEKNNGPARSAIIYAQEDWVSTVAINITQATTYYPRPIR